MGAVDSSMFKSKNKKASLLSATLLSATSMVGSGWLFSSQLTAKQAGNWAFLAWILAALAVMIVGLCLAVVVAKYPVRGAITRSSALSHNGIFGMPFAFANWYGIVVVVATEAQATTQYLAASSKSSILMQHGSLTIEGKLLALTILFAYLFINFYGIKLLAKVNNIVTIFKVFVPLFTVVVFLIAALDQTHTASNFALSSSSNYGPLSALTAIVGAGLIYSFNGFQISVAYASEIENPKRNVPLSIVISIVVVMFLYMGLQYAFMSAVPHDYLVSHGGWAGLNFHSPLLNLAMLLGINFMAILLIIDSVVSPSGTGYTYLGASSRMLYAMAAEGQMPRWIAKLCPVYNFSKRSMMINFILVAAVLWNSDSWAGLMIVVTGYHVVGYMAAPISMGAINRKTILPGTLVFIMLGLLMSTISFKSLIIMNASLTVIMIIYSLLQVRRIGLKSIFGLALPFVIYLWALAFCKEISLWLVALISVIFYLAVTSQKYIDFCKANSDEKTTIED